MDKISYALGMSLGQSLVGSGVKDLNFEEFTKGVEVIFKGETPKISADEGNEILEKFFTKVKEEKDRQDKKVREDNLRKAVVYLKENKNNGVIETKSGLQYKNIELTEGDKKRPGPHSRVKCHYEGRLTDGTIFDSSYKRGAPAVFSLDQVIPGWTEGLQLMGEGDKYEFTIPPALGYGEVGVPGHIPGNSVLIFTVELLEIL